MQISVCCGLGWEKVERQVGQQIVTREIGVRVMFIILIMIICHICVCIYISKNGLYCTFNIFSYCRLIILRRMTKMKKIAGN